MDITQEDIKLFINSVKEISTYDFDDYSIKSFTRRIEKILSDNKFDIKTLISKISKSKKYLEYIIKEITVNTTELFRDPSMWQTFKTIIETYYTKNEPLKIWHPGCSTGQEVYSLLIMLNELNLFDKVEVYGTDINQDVLDLAMTGKYKYRDIAEYIENYNQALKDFTSDTYEIPFSKYLDINKRRDTVKVKSFLLKKPIFKIHNLVTDGNIFDTKFNIIMCRNVLIYFNHDLQNKIFEFFYESLAEEGSLVIGRHEGILGPIASKFKKKDTIYIKKVKTFY